MDSVTVIKDDTGEVITDEFLIESILDQSDPEMYGFTIICR